MTVKTDVKKIVLSEDNEKLYANHNVLLMI